MEAFTQNLINWCTEMGLKLLMAALILLIGLKLVGVVARHVEKTPLLSHLEPSVLSFLHSCMVVVLDVLVVVTAALTLGIPATSFITLLASCGVAVGLALQGSLSNFAGGLMLLMFRPFKVGDYIIANTYEGTVREITVFYTFITTNDNRTVTIPNGTLTSGVVVNCSYEGRRRVDRVFTAAYDAPIDKVKQVLLQVAQSDPRVLADPAPTVCMSSQLDSALEYTLRAWCATEDYWDVYFALNEEAKKAFDQNGIGIPFPQRELHIIQDEK